MTLKHNRRVIVFLPPLIVGLVTVQRAAPHVSPTRTRTR
jgi:hypothetical protein